MPVIIIIKRNPELVHAALKKTNQMFPCEFFSGLFVAGHAGMHLPSDQQTSESNGGRKYSIHG